MSFSLEIGEAQWSGDNASFSLLGKTVGGPVDGRWERDGLILENSHQFTITYELDMSIVDWIRLLPYTSRIHVHGRYPGIYTYTATNRVTKEVFSDFVNIQGTMCFSMVQEFYMGSVGMEL